MNSEEEKILETLIAGGVIGAGLLVLIRTKEGPGAALGALAVAALIATAQAHSQAVKANVKLVTEEDGYLVESTAGGPKTIIRKIEKPATRLPKEFTLK